MISKIEISLSRTKITFFLVASIVFVFLGLLFIVNPESFISPIMRNREVIRISGIIAVFFFGFSILLIAIKLFDKKPGLIIDQQGITDNTSTTSVGLIVWEDIVRIEKRKVMSNSFLVLHIDKPEKYINRGKNIITKKALKMNFKTFGSPISIVSSSLKIRFDDLEKIVTSKFNERKKFAH